VSEEKPAPTAPWGEIFRGFKSLPIDFA